MSEVTFISPELHIGEKKSERVRYFCRILGTYYAEKGFAVCREVGLPSFFLKEYGEHKGEQGYLSKQRADFMAIGKDLQTIIVETKSCLADFTSDKKWESYLNFCNKFYFAAAPDVALKIVDRLAAMEGVAKYVGVFSISLDPHPCAILNNIECVRPAKNRLNLTPVTPLLWKMAARSSGFSPMGVFLPGNSFEVRHSPKEVMRIRS